MTPTDRAKIDGTDDDTRLIFWCPGCDSIHAPRVKGVNPWTWNGRLDLPTLQPSVLVTGSLWVGEGLPPKDSRCHSFVTDGRIQFLSDCAHGLVGQTVDLPPLATWRHSA